ncbi:MAG: DUF2577 domain-containing protein [Clostridia bacterium]|nr:DUF2577 domain-containing protein [Clostridia bacterium]
MGDPNSLKALIQELIPDPCGIFQGRVVSTSPLKIQALNDEKLIISALSMIVPKHLTDYTAEAEFSTGDSVTGGTITIRNGLKAGEKVHLLSLNHGKKYYVLDRVV